MTMDGNTTGRVTFRVREFGGVPIPELYPQGGRVFTIEIVGQRRVRQFAIPIDVVKTYQNMVREAARARRTYWVDLDAAEAFNRPALGADDSIPLRILTAIANGQVVTED